MSCKLSRDLMDAYVDGEIDLVRSLEIEQHLKECAACAQAFGQRRSFVGAVQAAPLTFAMPAGLAQNVRAAVRRSAGTEVRSDSPSPRAGFWSWNSWIFGMAGAGVMGFAALLLIPRFGGLSAENPVIHEVVSAHVRSLMAAHLTDIASSNQHQVKPWFHGKLDFAPAVRDYSDFAFPLVGGRLDYMAERPVAALVYRRDQHYINLFLWPGAREGRQAAKPYTRRGYNLLTWSIAGMTYWAISDLNTHDLQQFAKLVQAPAPIP